MKYSPITYIRWFLAEFLGTAILAGSAAVLITSAYLGIPGYEFIFIPFLMGIVIITLVLFFGWVSGSHFNPAVTISQLIFRGVTLAQAGLYLVAQLLGAWSGVKLANILLGTASLTPTASSTAIILGEFVGTLILGLAVMLVIKGKIESHVAPFALGAAITVGLLISAHTGGGVINPAVAFGLGSYTLTFLGIPIIGAICGAAIAVLFIETETPNRKG